MTTEHTDPVPDLTIPLAVADAQALGDDLRLLSTQLGVALRCLAQLRADGASTEHLERAIVVVTGLIERLEGVRDAAVRQHAAQGGSYGALATSMGVTRATAQYRRDALVKKDPSAMEKWATGSSS
ncbi:hypothetical protein ACFWP7_31540 [Streptomyces sp. NPDC058470]|uniref:hypothetical protein n=1 Tax=Streptomyces sp. NPDC058470 TaxID=3346515 RepID=UPI00366247F2